MMLGKLPPKLDKRTLRLSTVLKVLPPYPDAWDYDAGKSIPMPMFGNDAHGDCVIAGRGHMTLRFEQFEQGKIIPITDHDVLNEYWKEEGGTGPSFDKGLAMLDSLKAWRSQGWDAASEHYDIYAFASIDWKQHNEIMAAIYFLTGLYAGVALPVSAQNQEVWDYVDDPNTNYPGGWGGHCISIFSYSKDGLTCITWGKPKKMTWSFVDHYFDEAYGVVDDKDKFLVSSPLDIVTLDKYLADITGSPVPEPIPTPTPPPPEPSTCRIGNGIAKTVNLVPALLGRRGRFHYLNPFPSVGHAQGGS